MKNHRAHVGIIGCSAEGAALCYRTICLEGAEIFGRYAHPEVSMHTHCLADYMSAVECADWEKVAALMLSSANKLATAGAQILICPDNTVHEAFSFVEPTSPRPWLHIADVVAADARQQGRRRLGILGTKFLMEGPVYKDACAKAGLTAVIPSAERRSKINRIIFDELVEGVFSDKSREYFLDCIDELKQAGCDGVVLGCTEIPLIVESVRSSLPTYDSTRLLARAALHWASQQAESH